jgi:triosephosphate isomerase
MGQFTGHVLPESVAEAGCVGTLINHSERQLPLEVIKATIKRSREADLASVVCVDTVEKGRQVAAFEPDAIAIDPRTHRQRRLSLQGEARVISGAVAAIKHVNTKIHVLCGAGVTNGEDASQSPRSSA